MILGMQNPTNYVYRALMLGDETLDVYAQLQS